MKIAKAKENGEVVLPQSKFKSLLSINKPTWKPAVTNYNKLDSYEVLRLDNPKRFIAIDIETTGLNAELDEIIQIGAIKYDNGKELGRFSTYVRPTFPIPANASNVNHIYDNMVVDAPNIKSVLPQFLDFIEDYLLIAHNSDFDLKFIQTHLRYNNMPLIENNVIDTLEVARNFLFLDNYRLSTIRDYYKLDLTMHEATADCFVCAALYMDYLYQILPVFDEITDDIYFCSLVGHPTDKEEYYEKINFVCQKHGGKCYKSKAKSAKYIIIVSWTSQNKGTVEEYRNDGYKVTNIENASKYFAESNKPNS